MQHKRKPTLLGLSLCIVLFLQIYVPRADAYSWVNCAPQGSMGTLILDPTDGDHLVYIVGEHHKVFETADGGASWHGLGETLDENEFFSDIDTTRYPIIDAITRKDETQYSVTTRYRQSTDGGRTWSEAIDFPNEVYATFIRASSSHPGWLYVVAPSDKSLSILKSTDGGLHWSASGSLAMEYEQIVARDVVIRPGNPDTLYICGMINDWSASSRNLLIRTDDTGTSWSLLSSALPDEEADSESLGMTSLALAPTDPSRIYAVRFGSDGSAPLFRSNDDGQTWQRTDQPLWGSPYVRVDPFNADRLIVLGYTIEENTSFLNGDDFVISSDGGTAWGSRQRRFGMGARNLLFDPSIRNRLYITAMQGLFRSDDGGENWTRIDNGILESRVWDAAISGDRIYALKAYEGICHSGDNGGLWWLPRDSNEPTTECFALAVDPVRRARLLAVEAPRLIAYSGYLFGVHHVYRSSDGGSSWDLALDSDYLWTAVAFHPSHTGFAYAVGSGPSEDGTTAAADGLYFRRSYDYGQSWATPVRIDNGLMETLEAKVVAIAPSDDQVVYVAGTNLAWYYSDPFSRDSFDAIVYRSDDAGLTWHDAIGNLGVFGRATGGARAVAIDPTDPLHVFLATSLGVFETSNGGQTWARALYKTLSVYDLALDPVAGFLYAVTEEGVHRVLPSEGHWETILTAPYSDQQDQVYFSPTTFHDAPNLTIDPKNRCLYLSGSDHGLLRFDLDQYNAVSSWALYE